MTWSNGCDRTFLECKSLEFFQHLIICSMQPCTVTVAVVALNHVLAIAALSLCCMLALTPVSSQFVSTLHMRQAGKPGVGSPLTNFVDGT